MRLIFSLLSLAVLVGIAFMGWGIFNDCEPYASSPHSWWEHPLVFMLGWLEFLFIAFMNPEGSDNAFNMCKKENWLALNNLIPELKWIVLASLGYIVLNDIIEGEVEDRLQNAEGKVRNFRARKYASRTDGASNHEPKINRNRSLEEEVDSEEVVAKSRTNRKVKPSEENVLVGKRVQNKVKNIQPNSRAAGSVQAEKTSKATSNSVATKRANKSGSLAGKKSK